MRLPAITPSNVASRSRPVVPDDRRLPSIRPLAAAAMRRAAPPLLTVLSRRLIPVPPLTARPTPLLVMVLKRRSAFCTPLAISTACNWLPSRRARCPPDRLSRPLTLESVSDTLLPLMARPACRVRPCRLTLLAATLTAPVTRLPGAPQRATPASPLPMLNPAWMPVTTITSPAPRLLLSRMLCTVLPGVAVNTRLNGAASARTSTSGDAVAPPTLRSVQASTARPASSIATLSCCASPPVAEMPPALAWPGRASTKCWVLAFHCRSKMALSASASGVSTHSRRMVLPLAASCGWPGRLLSATRSRTCSWSAAVSSTTATTAAVSRKACQATKIDPPR